MRVLVTGATGFVGTHLVPVLVQRGHRVWGVGKSAAPADMKGMAGYHAGDLTCDQEGLRAFLLDAKVEVVVHLAGVASVSRSWDDPVGTIDSSVVASVNLHGAVTASSPDLVRWINVGSSEEYAPTDEVLTEEHAIGPRSPYGFAKVAQWRMLHWLLKSSTVDFVHFRPFNHVGPGQSRGFVIPDLAAQVLKAKSMTRPVLRTGSLDAVRDFLDVRDVVRAYVDAVEGLVPAGTYNIASGEPRSIRSVLDDLLRLTGVHADIQLDSELLRPVEIPVRVGSSARLQGACGWVPSVDWESTLAEIMSDVRSGVSR